MQAGAAIQAYPPIRITQNRNNITLAHFSSALIVSNLAPVYTG